MAKWGEGDPRWIVEERPDATNVNNWHWTEKNADAWSKKKLEELLTNFVVEEGNMKVTFEEMEKCEGEARANNRKAKLIFFYEWDLAVKWKHEDEGGKEVTGKLAVPNLSEEHENLDDVDLEVTLTSSSTPAAEKVKDFLRKGAGAAKIRAQLGKYVDALKSEFSTGLILPAANASGKADSKPVAPKPSQSTSAALKNLALNNKASSSSSSSDVITISLEERFKCTGQELYNALTQPEMLRAFTASPVVMKEAKPGEPFELLGGNIKGQFVSVSPFTEIVQKWRLSGWPEGHFSQVSFSVQQGKEDTVLRLTQTGVPTREVEATRGGWIRYYFEAIRRTFGFGASSL